MEPLQILFLLVSLVVVVAARLRRPLLLHQAVPVVQVALAPHRLFLVALLLTLAAVAVVAIADFLHRIILAVQVVLAVVEMVAAQAAIMVLLELPIQAAVAVAADTIPHQTVQAAQAALASSSSNTISALPQSSPSNPRSDGLHRLVRSALTTSL